MGRNLWKDRHGVSNIIVVVLSLIIIVVIVANVILWSYQMNQLDWEKMQENVSIENITRVMSAQTLFAHQETTNIGGTNYYQLNTSRADTAGLTLSVSMGSVGRVNFGKFVYPLTGITSIPASTWTIYYRAWKTGISFDAVSSGNNGEGSTSISWSHITTSADNRIMIVGVSIRNTTISVSSITYGSQSLMFIRSEVHPSATIKSELWYLIAPNSGIATVTVTLSGASKATGGSCTYNGVAQTSPLDTNDGGTGTSNSPSKSVTINTPNSWMLGHVAITGSSATISLEGSGQTTRWDQSTSGGAEATRNRGHGSDKGPVGTDSQSMSWSLSASKDWAVSVVAFKPAPVVDQVDVDILIRKLDGTIRTTIATNVADSANLTSTATTLSGTYSWTEYKVVDQTDYLEIDYYCDVSIASLGQSAYLRIDDNTLAQTDQTRITNIILPAANGTYFTFKNKGASTSHIVSLWIINSTYHQRYSVDIFLNSGQTLSYLRADISLPSGQYVVKIVTERGNTAVYSEG